MSSIVTPPTAPASQPPATPPPVAAAATGAPPPAPAAAVEAPAPSSDITIASTTDTAEQIAAALNHKIPAAPAPTAEEQAAQAAAAAAAVENPPVDAAAASEAARTLAKRKKTGHEEMRDRIDQVTFEREEQRRIAEIRTAESAANAAEAARLKAENEALRTGKPVPGAKVEAAAPPPKPELKDYEGQPDPYAAWTEAISDWKAERAAEKVRAEFTGQLSARDRAEQERRAQQTFVQGQEQTFATHKTRVDAFRSATPDYDAKVSEAMQAIKDSAEGVFFIPKELEDHVLHTETGTALFYNLVQDQKEFRRIATIERVGPMLVALGKYEAKLEAAGKLTPTAARPAPDAATRARDALTSSSSAAATVTTAPAPPPLVGNGSTASTVPLDQMDFRDFAAARNAAERTRRR